MSRFTYTSCPAQTQSQRCLAPCKAGDKCLSARDLRLFKATAAHFHNRICWRRLVSHSLPTEQRNRPKIVNTTCFRVPDLILLFTSPLYALEISVYVPQRAFSDRPQKIASLIKLSVQVSAVLRALYNPTVLVLTSQLAFKPISEQLGNNTNIYFPALGLISLGG